MAPVEFAIEHGDILAVEADVVALKYAESFYYLGIQEPAHGEGFLCARIDQETFTGDIWETIKKRIEAAAVVIAELSDKNPNVFLELGYAWGKGRPAILLVDSAQSLPFDVRGQRCLIHENRIIDLRDLLVQELRSIKARL